MEKLLTIDVTQRDGRCVVALGGEFDMSSSERFDTLLASLGSSDVVLDLTGLRFMDSTGIRSVIRMDDLLRAAGHELRVLLADDGAVRTVFRLTGVDERLRIS